MAYHTHQNHNSILQNSFSENACPVLNNSYGSPGHYRKPIRLKNILTKAESFDSLHFKSNEVSTVNITNNFVSRE